MMARRFAFGFSCACSWQIFRGDRAGRRLSIPEDGDDPVAIAILEQLDGVDAALEWLAVFGVARFVGGEDMHDIAEAFRGVVDASFEKAIGQRRCGALLILLRGEGSDVGAVAGFGVARRDEARIGNEEGAEAVPVARLAGRTGDDVVECGEDGVDGCTSAGLALGQSGWPRWNR